MTARSLKITVRVLRLLWRYRLRSGFLTLMAALGVAGAVCSVSYGAGGVQQILDQIRRMGTNVLILTPAESRSVAGRPRTGAAVTTLVERDYVSLRKILLSRTRSSAVVTTSLRIKAGDLSKSTVIVGVEPDYFAIKNWPVVAGEFFDAHQEETAARVALLGHTVAAELFGTSSPIGQPMMINRVPFVVAGVLAERGQGLDVGNEDSQIYVPLTTAMRRLMNVDHFDGIVIEVDSLNSMDAAADQMRTSLRVGHHIQHEHTDDFQIQNQKTLLATQMAAASRLNFFLQWIAVSALTVSGLGIVAITWIAWKERTREIGTRRALGATRNDIFFQALIETSSLAVCGSVLGVASSWVISRGISRSVGVPFVFESRTAAFALAAAVVLNLAFCTVPSRKAASVSPLEALRHE